MRTRLIAALLLVGPLSAYAKGSACPAAVKDAVERAHPSSKVATCKKEKQKDKVQYEVKLKTSEGKKLELDVSPEGSIRLTEEKIPVASVPVEVSKAFAARYPRAKATAAESQTDSESKVNYELAFKDGEKKKEATFDAKGNFISEE